MKREAFTLNPQSAKTKHYELLYSQGLEAGKQGDTKSGLNGEGTI